MPLPHRPASALRPCPARGIPEEEQEDLFSRFFRSSTALEHAIQGSGLGLTIVDSIVKSHGGDISVVSKHLAGLPQLTRISAQLVGRKGDGRRALTRPGRSEPDLVDLWGNRLACLLSTSDAADDLICVVLG